MTFVCIVLRKPYFFLEAPLTYLKCGVYVKRPEAGDHCFPLRCWCQRFQTVDVKDVCPINEQIFYIEGIMKPRLLAVAFGGLPGD